MKINNASQKPQRYFGLHMVEGVAEYREPGKDPYRILINEDAIKKMDQTFEGLPVYVHHVEEVNFENIQHEADGYVIKSFFNKADGKHWAEFIIVSDKGHEAIKIKKWKLSNAYIPGSDTAPGGQWHGVDYQKEVKSGVYEHLAIVPNPRYAESIILTPEEFKTYNNEKEIELTRLANSKGAPMLSFFKKAKVENADFAEVSVTLPKSKIEKTITQLVNEADERLTNAYMCNGDERVKVGESEMSVNELVSKHIEMTADKDPITENAEESDEEKKKKEMELEAAKKENDDSTDDDSMDNEADKEKEAAEKKKNELEKKANFEKLKNAREEAAKKPAPAIDLSQDKMARGQSRYGSN